MKLLLIRDEPTYFAGAEQVLCYYLTGLREVEVEVAVAATAGSRLWRQLPAGLRTVAFEDTRAFSLAKLGRQIGRLRALRREFAFDVIHGWTARDWELAALAGWLLRLPAVGTLHDHPRAGFISPGRQRLMKGCAQFGLRRVACVSEAVRRECLAAGYPAAKLVTIHNGLPEADEGIPLGECRVRNAPARIGFLGVLSERKGLRALFALLDALARLRPGGWELWVAGEAQDHEGKRLVEELRQQYEARPWWRQVNWLGWVKAPHEFLQTLDVLLVPSTEFDPFPTILLEAGRAGVPVVASAVGGVSEIVVDGTTGRLYPPESPETGAGLLAELLADAAGRRRLGAAARERIRAVFSPGRMAADYLAVYRSVLAT